MSVIRPSDSDLTEEIGPLVDALITGLMTSEQAARLEELVASSEESRWAYVQYIHDTVSIHRRVRENQLIGELRLPSQDEALLAAEGSQAADQSERPELLAWLAQQGEDGVPYILHEHLATPRAFWNNRQWKRRIRQAGWTVACCLMFIGACTLGWLVTLGGPAGASVDSGPPAHFAKIIRSTDCAWKQNGTAVTLQDGDWLTVGRYTLSSGLAKIVFPWGTEATLEAPTELEFTSSGARQLWHGQLVAKVSPEDTGFTIDTPSVKLIDLGTEFGLSTDLNGSSEVHVFKGAVEVRPHFMIEGTDPRSITLSTGEANGFTSQSLPIRQIAFNPKRFSRAWRLNNQVSQTTGAMRFVHPAPVSVVEGQAEANDAMLLFLEREDQVLPASLAVTATEPGLYTTFNNRLAWLPSGIHVDSYLVHFDPVGSRNTQAPVVAEGAVTFDKPILAIIARGDQLAASDGWLASPGTGYQAGPSFRRKGSEIFSSNVSPSYAIRGLSGLWNVNYSHESPAPNDWVRLSADRKTLSVRCIAGGEADQLRILVSSDGEAHQAVVAAPQQLHPEPFRGSPYLVGETIEAEDFDLGGQDVAYHDLTPDSLSNVYRSNESIELKQYIMGERTITNVSVARAGEWIAYTVQIDTPGLYVIEAQAGSRLSGGKFRFELGALNDDAPTVTESLEVPATSLEAENVDAWYSIAASRPVQLKAGRQILRVIMEANHSSGRLGNFDWFRIVSAPPENEHPATPVVD